MNSLITAIADKALELGASAVGTAAVSDVVFNTQFRKICARNQCGTYGKSYMCPPDCGEIQDLITKLKAYETAVVYQTVGTLEDSFDAEGMAEWGNKHHKLVLALTRFLLAGGFRDFVNLAGGGCHICPQCGKVTGEPCRHPDIAISAMSAHGIDVSALAARAGMKYMNGQNTVTYFGAVFL